MTGREPQSLNCGGGWRKLVPAFAGIVTRHLLLGRILSTLWIIAVTSLIIWLADLNDHDYVICDDDHSPSGYCAQLGLEPQK